jgi:aspartate 1-decarboxylase
VNGAAAHKAQVGDLLIIASYGTVQSALEFFKAQ